MATLSIQNELLADELPIDLLEKIENSCRCYPDGEYVWRHRIKVLYDAGSTDHFNTYLPKQFFSSVNYRIQGQNIKIFAERSKLRNDGNSEVVSHAEISFDGQNFFLAEGKGNRLEFKPDMLIVNSAKRRKQESPRNIVFTPNYFLFAGIYAPRRYSQFPGTFESELKHFINHENKIETQIDHLTDERFAIVEIQTSSRTYKYFFEQNNGYYLAKRETFGLDGIPLIHSRVDSRRDDGLPKNIFATEYTEDGKKLFEHSITLEELHTDTIPQANFVLRYETVGTVISSDTDPRTGEALDDDRWTHTVPAKASDLDEALKEVEGYKKFQSPKFSFDGTTGILFFLLLIISLAVVWRVRFLHQSTK